MLYGTGKGEGKIGADSTEFKQYTNKASSTFVATSQSATILYDLKDNAYYAVGRNPNRMLVSTNDPIHSEYRFTVKGKKLQQISVGPSHAVMLFANNTLYACPNEKKELFGAWADGATGEYYPIPLAEDIGEVKKVIAMACGTLMLCTNKKTGKMEARSFGKQGEVGIGQGAKKDLDQYLRLDYPEDLEFKELVGCENAAAAISTKGELYTWGKGPKGILGLYKADGSPVEEANKPTKVEFLGEKCTVEKVSVGATHMLVIVQGQDGVRKVWGLGDNSKGQLGNKDPKLDHAEIALFAGKYPSLVCAGTQCSFVVCSSRKAGQRENCAVHSRPCGEVTFVRKDKDGPLRCWCQDCLSTLPSAVVATRWPVSRAAERPWPDLAAIEATKPVPAAEMVRCSTCGQQIKGAIYKNAGKDEILCEGCFLKTPTTMDPALYYRLANEGMASALKQLPGLEMGKFYDASSGPASFSMRPVYKLDLPEPVSDKAIKLTLEEYLAESKAFEREHDMDILGLINECILTKDKSIQSVQLKGDLSVPFARKTTLGKFRADQLKRRLYMLIKLNKMLYKTIKFIDFTSHAQTDEDLYMYYIKVKDYVASQTKDSMAAKAMENLPANSDRPSITLARHKAFVLHSSGQVDHAGKLSLFGQLMQATKDRISIFQKKPGEDSYPYRVEFKGEGGSDAGGLFRESIDQICEELQSSCLPLFIPTPNNKTAFGEDREKWTITPSSKQATHLEMYGFLGCMIGMSFRMGHVLAVNLTSLFWKQLLGDPVDRSDLKAIDSYCVQCLDDIVNIEKKGVDAGSFESYIDTYFVTRLSDGSEVELKKGGKEIRVTFANRLEYVQLVEKARLEEGALQMKEIRAGLAKIAPISIVKLYSWRDIEVKVCGKPTFKVEALKKITQYSVLVFAFTSLGMQGD